MLSPYWASQLQPWQRGMGNIGTALMRGPLLRSQAITQGARAIQAAEMAKEAQARAGLLDAQRQEIATGDTRIDNATTAASAASKAFLAYQQNPTPDNRQAWQDAVSDATGKASVVKNMKVGDLIKAIGQTGALDLSGSGSTNYAQIGADQGGATSIANAITAANERAQRPVIIPSGGTEATPTGGILAQGGVTLPAGGQRLGPVAGTAAPGVVGNNPKAGTITSAFMKAKELQDEANADNNMTAESPGVLWGTNGGAYDPNATVTLSQQDLTPVAVPAQPSVGSGNLSGQMVRIQDSLGNVGTIPAENLAAALQRGAKQLQ